MSDLLLNPNRTSSLLFRAEIYYDSTNDTTASYEPSREGEGEYVFSSNFVKHMNAALRPRGLPLPGNLLAGDGSARLKLDELVNGLNLEEKTERRWRWDWQRTVVRNLVPRNPKRDKPCVQSCWYFRSAGEAKEESVGAEQEERDLVVYIPHVDSVEEVPFYHPACRGLAMVHRWNPNAVAKNEVESQQKEGEEGTGSLSLFYSLFPETPLSDRLSRTANTMLTTIAKHCSGQAAGYVKRVHHDLIVPQKDFQNTYTRLKAEHAKSLSESWVETTDPTKHVFEDLGIASFLIELWKIMYNDTAGHPPAGFIDVGCGNGVLTYILLSEGYAGSGFDIRKRKTWEALPQEVVAGKLTAMTCIPAVLQVALQQDELSLTQDTLVHDGLFERGTFVISNHADELTGWTPLLAYMSECPFIAIPCCSHDFGGNRFRAKAGPATEQTSQSQNAVPPNNGPTNGPQSGELKKKPRADGKPPSAYATLCRWLERLTTDVGFVTEKEVLRIPSTRNMAIIGRSRQAEWPADESVTARRDKIAVIVERETNKSLVSVARDWVGRSMTVASSKGAGH